VSILIDKMEVNNPVIVATDGFEDTLALLEDNIKMTKSGILKRRLFWGEYSDFLTEFPGKFDTVIAADVIYEKEHVKPLIDTVVAILKGENY
jgi:predicted nicotinamide N-methyase